MKKLLIPRNIMHKKTLLFSILFFTSQNIAMQLLCAQKRTNYPRQYQRRQHQRQITYFVGSATEQSYAAHQKSQTKPIQSIISITFPTITCFPNFSALPPDIHTLIIKKWIDQAIDPLNLNQKRKESVRRIHSLALVNKFFYQTIDLHSDEIITKLSKKYHCSHETSAKLLRTPKSRGRLHIQSKLQSLCLYIYPAGNDALLKRLIAEKVDLNFSYNHQCAQKTALMIALANNINFFRTLLSQYKKDDINRCTPNGWSLLNFLINNKHLRLPRSTKEHVVEFLLQQGGIDVNLKNFRGETPLLQLLCNWKNHNQRIAELLLENGADPTIKNQWEVTPITVATSLGLAQIIDLMQKTIKNGNTVKKS